MMNLWYTTLALLMMMTSHGATAQECRVAMGVSQANSVCDELITDEIKQFISFPFEQECAVETHEARRHLRSIPATNDQRDLSCANYYLLCTMGAGQYYCEYHAVHCTRRGLSEQGELEVQEDNNSMMAPQEQEQVRVLTEDPEDPLTAPGWESCKFPFGQFINDVTDFMGKYEKKGEIVQCFKYMWCRVKKTDSSP
uniref:Uncharacterized protein n=1 Tax=Entomoneis paludosa TaxID=265537 RepID=A0A7S2VCN4_9STRA|mmetsp:Transcript_12883/g.26723  ORF Transcript_12883/g.26723 Transcript_12883/m.26723 type:complete len:197 (+) Transcript_12883:198-788(+)